jgi:desulfoferrodoxin-like iron-binding protein
VANQLGKRYRCSVCGTEALCTKAGDGSIVCCDKEMEVQAANPLPSSD